MNNYLLLNAHVLSTLYYPIMLLNVCTEEIIQNLEKHIEYWKWIVMNIIKKFCHTCEGKTQISYL